MPSASDIVAIAPGTTVTYDVIASPALDSVVVYAGGVLTFRTDVSTQLLVTHLQVLEGGELRVGTAANPVQAAVTAQIVIRNVELDATRDPEHFGNGLIALGKVSMHGAVQSHSFVRLASEPRVGQTSLTLAEPVTGWKVGDRLALPDTRHLREGEIWSNYNPQWELGTIQAISADGRTITLSAPITYDHVGARDGAGVLEFLPHVANLTRNVTVKSQSASGTRGYALFTHRADVDIRYTSFAGLGRTTQDAFDNTTFGAGGVVTHVGTNQSGRYPISFSHLYGPAGGRADGYQFTFVGNSVFCPLNPMPFRWGITINDSHYGLISDNVLYNWAGAGLVTESGNESFNVIEKNFVLGARGNKNPRNNDGLDGSLFWFAGFNNYVRNNVASSGSTTFQQIVAGVGYKYYIPASGLNARVPLFKGASTAVDGQYQTLQMRRTPILEFDGNEAYGAMATGMTIWHLGTDGYFAEDIGQSVIKDFRVWHAYDEGFFAYPIQNVLFDGYVVRGHSRALNPFDGGIGWQSGDYWAGNVTIRNADIQGMYSGLGNNLNTPGTFRIEDSYFRNYLENISVATLATPGSGASKPARRTEIRNVQFEPMAGSVQFRTIDMKYDTHHANTDVIQTDEVFVYNYNGTGQNYRIYYAQQRADFIVPQTVNGIIQGSPVPGLTNQQTWDLYGIAIAGAVAPADATTASWTNGLVRVINGLTDTTAPTIDGVGANSITTTGATIQWTTNEASTTQVQYGLTTSYGSSTALNSALLTSHSASLTGLTPGATYHYRVKSRDAAGNLQVSPNFTFTTTPDLVAPTISGVTAGSLTSTSALIAWTTNEAADTQVEYGLTTSYGSATSLNATLVSSHTASLSGLVPGTTYHYRIKSRDAAGNLQVSGDFNFTTPLTVRQIVDDGSAGATRSGKWRRVTGKGYENDIVMAAKGNGSTTASWTFNDLQNGSYQVWTTWKIAKTNATNAPFTAYDGGTSHWTVRVNQRLTPSGLSADGALWKLLGTVTINSGKLTVKLTNAADGQVIADAVRIDRIVSAPAPAQPEINVAAGGATLTSVNSTVDFGSAAVGVPQSRTFTVTNQGTAPLTLTAINPVGVPSGFSLVQSLGSITIAAGTSTTFTLQLDAISTGSFGGWISLQSNDGDESPFWFQVLGTVADPNAPLTKTMDDGWVGHSLTGSWTRHTSKGHSGDIVTANAGAGATQSKWTFSNVLDGNYQVWATWKIAPANATNAPFTLYDGTTAVVTVRKNQRLSPTVKDGTTLWERLGTVTVTSGKLVIKLTNAANGQVIADAIRIERLVSNNIASALLPLPFEPDAGFVSTAPELTPNANAVPWPMDESTEFRPELRLLDEAVELLNSARLASSHDDSIHRFAADDIAREALLSVLQ